MNKELIEALEILEKEKNISKATMLEAIENSLLTACKNHFGKADNVKFCSAGIQRGCRRGRGSVDPDQSGRSKDDRSEV